MNRVLFDTSVLVALVDSLDKWHSVAIEISAGLKAIGAGLIYLDPVINEAVSVLARRCNEQRRSQSFGVLLNAVESLAPPERITWVSTMTQRLYPQITDLVREHDGVLNFHDALIALSSRELGFTHIASFDAGYDRVPWLKRLAHPRDIEASTR